LFDGTIGESLRDSEVLISDLATAAQGALASTAVQPGTDAGLLGSGAIGLGYMLAADGSGGIEWSEAGVSLDLVADPDPTNVTTSYHAEIAAAIEGADGKVVHLNNGSYYVSTGMTVEGIEDTVIMGPGTIRFTDITALRLLGTKNVRFMFVTFEYVGASAPTTARAVYLTDDGITSSLRNRFLFCRFKNAKTAIQIENGAIFTGGLVLIGNEFDTVDVANSVAVQLDATDCQVYSNKIIGYNTGIYATAGSQQLQGNHIFKGSSTSYDYGVRLDAPTGIQVVGNYFDNAGTAGLFVRPTTTQGISGLLVSNNLFMQGDGNVQPFISFGALLASSLVRDTQIIGNSFRQLGASENTSPIIFGGFIDLVNSSDFEVDGNVFSNATKVATRLRREVAFASGVTTQTETFTNLIGNIGHAQITGINTAFYYGSIVSKNVTVKVDASGGSDRQVFVTVHSVVEPEG
jgi:hypothetical protein